MKGLNSYLTMELRKYTDTEIEFVSLMNSFRGVGFGRFAELFEL